MLQIYLTLVGEKRHVHIRRVFVVRQNVNSSGRGRGGLVPIGLLVVSLTVVASERQGGVVFTSTILLFEKMTQHTISQSKIELCDIFTALRINFEGNQYSGVQNVFIFLVIIVDTHSSIRPPNSLHTTAKVLCYSLTLDDDWGHYVGH